MGRHTSQTHIYPQVLKLVRFRREAPGLEPLAQGVHLQTRLVSLLPGQVFPSPPLAGELVFFVLRGQGQLELKGTEHALGPGSMAFIPNRCPCKIQAATKMVILQIIGLPHALDTPTSGYPV
ncbi:AraC family ligand binding domain-containing protein [Thermus sp. LT1-2-5]|uniref:AraC family ligand binding domain-containing protein n=1 Tax=Thermus sp. LT1-2-5 TaxID=3026935 RepID=UPI003365562A